MKELIAAIQGALVQNGRDITGANDGEVPSALFHHDVRLESLERFLPAPLAIRGAVALLTVESFANYVTRFRSYEENVIFAGLGSGVGGEIVAVLDYPQLASPSWGAHRAVFRLQPSEEWMEWTAQDGKDQAQTDLAEFLEDHAADVVKPSSAELLTIVKHFETTTNVEFKSVVNVDRGDVALAYSTETAVKGQFEVPKRIEIAIPLYRGGPRYKIEARFRFRIKEGKLLLRYDLVRLPEVVEFVHEELVEKIAALTGVPVLLGVAPSFSVK